MSWRYSPMYIILVSHEGYSELDAVHLVVNYESCNDMLHLGAGGYLPLLNMCIPENE